MSVHHDDGGRPAYFGPEEAQRLRDYLMKGGFLWADDFWGSYAWENWESEFTEGPAAGRVSDRRPARSIIHSSDRSS